MFGVLGGRPRVSYFPRHVTSHLWLGRHALSLVSSAALFRVGQSCHLLGVSKDFWRQLNHRGPEIYHGNSPSPQNQGVSC